MNSGDKHVSLKHYIDQRVQSVEKRIEDLTCMVNRQVKETRENADEAVRVSEKASEKALAAIDKRLEGMNEFRAQLNDQQRTYVPRNELDIMFKQNGERLAKVEDAIIKISSQKSGYAQGMGTIVLIAGVISTLVVLISHMIEGG